MQRRHLARVAQFLDLPDKCLCRFVVGAIGTDSASEARQASKAACGAWHQVGQARRQQHCIRQSVRHMEQRAYRAAHAVHHSHARIVDANTGIECGTSHFAPGIGIAAIGVCHWQVPHYAAHGSLGERVGLGRGFNRHIRLHRMGQGIKPCGRRHTLRRVHAQRVVNYGKPRQQHVALEQHLYPTLGVGDYGETCSLRTRAGCRGYGHYGRHIPAELLTHIVGYMAWVAKHSGNGLCRIHRTSAPYAYAKVAPLAIISVNAILHHSVGRFAVNQVKHHIFHSGTFKHGLQPLHHGRTSHMRPCHHKRFAPKLPQQVAAAFQGTSLAYYLVRLI